MGRRRNREPSRRPAEEKFTPPARTRANVVQRIGVLVVLLAAVIALAIWLRPAPDFERMIAEIRLNLEHGETAKAEQLLEEVLAHDPANGMALMFRGQLALDRGDWERAIEDFRRVPDEPAKVAGTARYLEASVLLQRGRAREAEAKLLEAIQLNPDYLQPHERHLQLCVVQMRRDATLERLAALRQRRRLTLEELGLQLIAGDHVVSAEAATNALRNFFAEDPDDVRSAVALARYLAAEKKGSEAVTLLKDLLRRHPDEPSVRGLLAELLVEQGELATAQHVAASLPLESQAPVEAWRAAAKIAQAQREFGKAADYYGQVVRLAPEDFKARYQWGQVLLRAGRAEEAKQELERSVHYDRLQHHVLSATRIDPERSNILLPAVLDVARSLRRLHRDEQAMAWLEIALAIDPQHGDALAELEAVQTSLRTTLASRSLPATEAVPATGSGRRPTPARTASAAGDNAATANAAGHNSIQLRDVHGELGVEHRYFNGQSGFKYLIESMGGGVAVLDYDADGWPDLYFPQGAPLPLDPDDRSHADRLYRNRGDGTFEDVTDRACLTEHGYSQGCAVGDLDNDGYDDLVIANYGRNTVYRNNGDGTFVDVTERTGALAPEMSSSVALADLDRDGNLDIYVANYVDGVKVCRDQSGRISTCDPSNFGGVQDRLYRSRGDGTFEDITETCGIVAPDGKGLGIVVADFDDDAWPDVYVANDGTPNFLFRSQRGKADGASDAAPLFREEGLISGTAVSGEGRAEAGMGIACGDLNGDGRLDLLTTNYFLETVTYYMNHGDGFFSDETRAAGLADPTERTLGFGTQALDLDLDGDLELFLANGHIDDFEESGAPWKMPPQLFANDGTGKFAEISLASGSYFAAKYLGRGAARWDWNRDGRPDLVVVHQDAPAAVLSNETKDTGNRVVVELHGVQSNRSAIGTRILIEAGGRRQVIEVCGGDGFYSSNERRQFIGVGKATQIDRLEVRWPSGVTGVYEALPVNHALALNEGGDPRVSALRAPEGGL